jgi:hypothetical protein
MEHGEKNRKRIASSAERIAKKTFGFRHSSFVLKSEGRTRTLEPVTRNLSL